MNIVFEWKIVGIDFRVKNHSFPSLQIKDVIVNFYDTVNCRINEKKEIHEKSLI